MRVVCVAGARPNYMKVKPVLDALEERGVDAVLVHTGQHYDPMLNEVFFDELGLRPPDHFLGVGSGSHAEQSARVMTAFEPLVEQLAPDVVVVVGDVNSTLACALVAAKAGPRVAHVEAGLRSRDWSMPEEVNGVVTDRVSDWLLASSEDAVGNLRGEGYRDDQIHLVGKTMIDTLLATSTGPSAWVAPAGIILCEPLGYLDFLGLEAGARLVLTDSGGVQEETTVLGVPCLTFHCCLMKVRRAVRRFLQGTAPWRWLPCVAGGWRCGRRLRAMMAGVLAYDSETSEGMVDG